MEIVPAFCCGVVGCASNSAQNYNKDFFLLPAERDDRGRFRQKWSQRRQAWIQSLRRQDLTETKLKYLRICSDHFITGRPAALDDEKHIDYVPSKNMGYRRCYGSKKDKQKLPHMTNNLGMKNKAISMGTQQLQKTLPLAMETLPSNEPELFEYCVSFDANNREKPMTSVDPLSLDETKDNFSVFERDFCRLCLIHKPQYFSNFYENPSALKMFQSLTSITVSEEISMEICEECFVKLEMAFEYQQTFITNDNRIRQQFLLETKVKSEPAEDVNIEIICDQESNNSLSECNGPSVDVEAVTIQICDENVNSSDLPLNRLHEPLSEVKFENDFEKDIKETETTMQSNLTDFFEHHNVTSEEVTADDVSKTVVPRTLQITQDNFNNLFFNTEELKDVISEETMSNLKEASRYLCCGNLFFDITKLLDHVQKKSPKAFKHIISFLQGTEKVSYKNSIINIAIVDRTCIICLKLINIDQYRDHILKHNSGYCDYCGRTLTHRQALQSHIQNVHSSSLQCEHCGIVATSAKSLKFHQNKNHLREATHVCNICDYKCFGNVSSLREHHIRKHSTVKPLRCDLCNKQFASLSNLKNHMLSHSNVILFTCEYCGRGFKQAANLRGHQKNVHRVHK